ncbi:DUF4129 domain-containing protein [Algoriphagus sp. AGSA1]|uniref:DUF4129 domain-containing protein n=1 Tax=Algoriphagus sp. AGSA1 TaxID=2907213 RepID=UPI001F3CE6A5|nr:DUF4129 domain-containing protein [Algoriphagus sp. AGSA1]MCE7054325.1 DUF4129 domain-containing protein [Algoriphagus sp. AGSA1]
MARTALIALLLFLFQCGMVLAMVDRLQAQDSVDTGLDSPGFIYHKAWSFEAGYEDTYLSQAEYDYEEIRQEKNWLQRAKLWFTNAWNKFLDRILGGSALSGFWQVFFQLAPYLLLVMLMSLLVWIAMKYSSGGSQDGKIGLSSLSADEVLLESDNLSALVEEALGNQDFRLALRYRYLSVLQQLIRRKLIAWKSSKTNFDYQIELRETPFVEPFTEVTRIYNFVWYGHFDLDAEAYGALEGAFNHLEQLS